MTKSLRPKDLVHKNAAHELCDTVASESSQMTCCETHPSEEQHSNQQPQCRKPLVPYVCLTKCSINLPAADEDSTQIQLVVHSITVTLVTVLLQADLAYLKRMERSCKRLSEVHMFSRHHMSEAWQVSQQHGTCLSAFLCVGADF